MEEKPTLKNAIKNYYLPLILTDTILSIGLHALERQSIDKMYDMVKTELSRQDLGSIEKTVLIGGYAQGLTLLRNMNKAILIGKLLFPIFSSMIALGPRKYKLYEILGHGLVGSALSAITGIVSQEMLKNYYKPHVEEFKGILRKILEKELGDKFKQDTEKYGEQPEEFIDWRNVIRVEFPTSLPSTKNK